MTTKREWLQKKKKKKASYRESLLLIRSWCLKERTMYKNDTLLHGDIEVLVLWNKEGNQVLAKST